MLRTPISTSSVWRVNHCAATTFSYISGAARLEELRRVGMGALTDILNTVAPPISEHEVLKVWLSHDLQGYDGIESLVYKSLARVCSLPLVIHCMLLTS